MAAFRFAAADTSGKEQSGVLEADSARVARQLLRGRGLIPLKVEPVFDEIASGTGVSMRLGAPAVADRAGRHHAPARLAARRAAAGRRCADRDGRAEREAAGARADGVDPHRRAVRYLAVEGAGASSPPVSRDLPRTDRRRRRVRQARVGAWQPRGLHRRARAAAAEDHAGVRLSGDRHAGRAARRHRPAHLRGAAGRAGIRQHQAKATVPDDCADRGFGFRAQLRLGSSQRPSSSACSCGGVRCACRRCGCAGISAS